jgi:hypothetical protein
MRLLILAVALAIAPAALAQPVPPPACVDGKAPAHFAPWESKAAAASATGAAGLAAATLDVGKAYDLALKPTPDITYVSQPEKPGGSVSKGGLFQFKVVAAGTYSVALSAAPWVDVVKDGKKLDPVSFGHGPECTTIRKMVSYALQPGDYTVQVSASADPQLGLMVFRKP